MKSGFVAILGLPNAGKSTLMNALIGEKLSIITNKPQTTRKKILGILTTEEYQIIFLDTPGILEPEYLLQEKMLESVKAAANDADVILFLIDINSDPQGNKTFTEKSVIEILDRKKIRKILLLNKIDLSNQKTVKTIIEKFSSKDTFEKVIPISAAERYNLDSVIEAVLEYLPVHPKFFPGDDLSDANERFFVSEIIREKIFEQFRDEIPYSTEVIIEEFKERENRKDYISASIIVERETQKPIIIGNKGQSIKKIGERARAAVEQFLGRAVFLELRVKVRNKWRNNANLLKSFGYDISDE